MPIVQFFRSIRDSETITCPQCNARQFPTNGTCVRCHSPLGVNYISVELHPLLSSGPEVADRDLARSIGEMLRRLRKRRGICQSQLARRTKAGIARTSLSKVENGRMLLPVYKLLALLKALGVTAVILRLEMDRTGTAQAPQARNKR